MDYSQLSNRDIDALVLQEIYGNQAKDKDIMRAWLRGGFKYTANPADAWPIIVGHKLSLINADDEWLCVPDDTAVDGTTGDDVQMIYSRDGYVHANPLRAAMVVFLMMQENQNG
ncbi:phage protein NinX family protein [Enterobacter hormaechei]|nr:DUF2591 family protein [Enterobacter hormaechei]ELI6757635.1 DUF2591 family protein [Enterobacter hormaechei subsp. xiangfangensis]ELX7454690.1 DUF2591 family protein [Enterobacter hormaechei subsp. hoffmannii]ELD4167875.1 DUF2591 family protein [Enterobacter hormaechei]ELD4169535.1 DUF2591 family protein [Enterobacter hormaechei]